LKKTTWKDNFLFNQFKWVLGLLSVTLISVVIYFFSAKYNNESTHFITGAKHNSRKDIHLQLPYYSSKNNVEIAYVEKKNAEDTKNKDYSSKTKKSQQETPTMFDFNHQSSAEHQWVNNEGAITAINLKNVFNSAFADFAPVVSNNNNVMFFTSRRAQNINNNSQTREYVYFSTKDKKTEQWTEPILLGAPFNKKNSYNSIISINETGDKIFLYQDDRKTYGDIFETSYKNNAWTEPVPLPFPINSPYIETSIAYNSDSSVVIFTSNRPGGYGDMDIWFAAKNNDGTWCNAINAGPLINTNEKEDGVFTLPDGETIIFSSNGHLGLGGHDIFYTKLINGSFSAPQNMGKPINSNADDIYFYLPQNSTTAYFSSNRKGGVGEKDIYSIPFEDIENYFISSNIKLNAAVYDKETHTPIDTYIEIWNVNTQTLIKNFMYSSASNNNIVLLPKNTTYEMRVYKKGYMPYVEQFAASSTNALDLYYNISLAPISPNNFYLINNLQFNRKKNHISSNTVWALSKIFDILQQNPQITISFAAISFQEGMNNMDVLSKVVENCIEYLIDKGIDKSRLLAFHTDDFSLTLPDQSILSNYNNSASPNKQEKNMALVLKIETSQNKTF
jgi:hypothetical protein